MAAIIISIASPSEVEFARREARELGIVAGMSGESAAVVGLIVSELATNLLRYARNGRIALSVLSDDTRIGVAIQSQDDGPGIPDLELALSDGYSTGTGYGDGLPAVKRLADTLQIRSGPAGTWIEARTWAKRGR